MQLIKGSTFAEIYKQSIEAVMDSKATVSPRGMEVKEVSNMVLQLTNPYSNLYSNDNRSPSDKYLKGELKWYFLGRNDLKYISQYSNFWNKLADKETGKLSSAYGYTIFKEKNEFGYTEWEWALDALRKDEDTRQAIVRFSKPYHSFQDNKDFVCTLNGVFNIRNDKLNLTMFMRSSDAFFGIVYDVPFFTLLMQQMRLQLLDNYPDLELGEYIHHSVSYHIYEKDYETFGNMLKFPFAKNSTPKLTESMFVGDTSTIRPDVKEALLESKYLNKNKFVKWLVEKN
ncbi:MAG TPA: thymidylate synthase [Saccharofermentans sp.]|nr:thymidylate synthase [Saccharofermentans sp.]